MNLGSTENPLRVMLVEDSEHEHIALDRAFRRSSIACRVSYCVRAEAALQALAETPDAFDVVVSDFKLPGLSGVELYKEAKRLGIQKPFIIMSGFGSEKMAEDVLQDGLVEYLVKDQEQRYLEVLPVLIRESLRKHNDRVARSKMEEALRNSERRLADIINFLPDAVFAIDLEGKIIIWNRTAEELTGIKAEQMLGKGDYEYALPFYGERRPLLIDLVFKRSEAVERHYPLLRREGDTIRGEAYTRSARRGEAYLFGVAAPLYDSDGRIIGAIETVRDITERKHDEEALIESEQKLKSVVDGSPIPLFVIAKDHTITFWNHAIAELTGISSENAIGCCQPWCAMGMDERPSMADLLLDGQPQRIVEICKGVCGKSRLIPDAYEVTEFFPAMGREKESKWLYMCAVTIKDSRGNVIGAMQTMVDVTSRKLMEDELLKAQKLESIALLAGGIAHDYNNVLTSIMGNISLAKLLTQPGDRIYERLEAAEQASVRARNMTKRLITFARGGAPVKRPVCVDKVVHEAAELALSGSRCSCEYQIPEDVWQIEVDEGQVCQALGNIIINADQQMPDGGNILVSCENVQIETDELLPLEQGRYVRIDVEDHGAGIPEECLRKVFDPYFTTRESGKGLGLTLAYSVAKRHAGHIAVKSRIGEGAVFSIYLPASQSAVLADKSVDAALIAGAGRLLIMDDEEIVRVVLSEMLTHLGYEAACSSNGSEAIEMYASAAESGSPFDAVIMDLTIPGGMGGKEAVKRLREVYPQAKVIVSSGYSNDPVMAEYRDYGFCGVVLKPYQVAELSGVLKEVLAKVA